MKLKPEELKAQGYTLLDSLEHMDLVPFVRLYLKKKTVISLIYVIANVVIGASSGFWFYYTYHAEMISFGTSSTYFSYGLAIAFALIPLHEYIHVLAYKSQGALQTSYDVNWKKFYFMALADKFVATKREFSIVALAPFVVISSALLVLLFVVSLPFSFTVLGVLLTHTAFSSGDFGILSYFYFHSKKEVVTYDDQESGISYFYGRERAS